jgi:haloacid dehalogenase-like hydrolase
VITGDQLRRVSIVGLQLALDEPEIIFARVGADQKMRIVEALIKKKHVVAVTGDGVNDAPALKCAHIGIAMGITGTDVAKQAADMVLIDDNFASIVSAVEEGRAVFQNIRKFLIYVLVHNVAELVPYLAFALFRIPLPLTPIQALSVDMGTDRPRPWRGTARSAGYATAAAPADGEAVELARSVARVSLLGADRGCRRDGSILLRSAPGRLELWAEPGRKRPNLSARHYGLSERHHRHADCQRVPV